MKEENSEMLLTAAENYVEVIPIDTVRTIADYDISSEYMFDQTGTASYYGRRFHRRKTANGERYNMNDFTAAHKELPFGSILRVTRISTGKSVLVRVNDRGPYIRKRVIDLSRASAREIDGIGLSEVKIEGFPAIKNISKAKAADYIYGLSFDKPLVCLPADFFTTVDSAFTFTDAVKMYKTRTEASPELNLYLTVAVENVKRRESKNNYNYFISSLPDDKSVAAR
ncbi:MAG: septal ring lytic transglycosylase RlpA family protein [Chlorobi bacterium]|nr:septal ring lytic transglycosylase RlpA family protein [Chlorobiota bacterium]